MTRKQVDDVSFKILQMRDVRHRAVWPTMVLCVLLLAVYLYLGARECRGSSGSRGAAAVAVEDDDDDNVDVRGKRRRCCGRRGGRCLRLVTFLLAFLVWMTAAGSVTLSGMFMFTCVFLCLVRACACVRFFMGVLCLCLWRFQVSRGLSAAIADVGRFANASVAPCVVRQVRGLCYAGSEAEVGPILPKVCAVPLFLLSRLVERW